MEPGGGFEAGKPSSQNPKVEGRMESSHKAAAAPPGEDKRKQMLKQRAEFLQQKVCC